MNLNLLNIPSNKIKQLENKGIYSIPDLLKYIPKEYYDFRKITKISDIKNKEKQLCAFWGKVISKKTFDKVTIVTITDNTGYLTLSWFHNLNMVNRLIEVGKNYFVCGKPYIDNNYNNINKMTPILFNSNKYKYMKLIPVYKKITGMSDDYLKDLINRSLMLISNSSDFITNDIREEFHLISEYEAFKKIHQPSSSNDIYDAKKRFIFDDLFIWNFKLKSQRKTKEQTTFLTSSCKDWTPIYKELPFDLTIDQKNTIKQIYYLMKSKKGVNALIQGDVGSGKTIIAEFILATCAENKFQSCLIAPTEVLAKQHYIEIANRFKNLNYNVAYLSSAIKTKERNIILNDLKNGNIDIIIGTHAIMGKDVVFKNLGMVICDEEHRFGVLQREFYKKDYNFYIENLPYVIEINKVLKKRKMILANHLFRNIDIDNINIEEEMKYYKDLDTKNLVPAALEGILEKRLKNTILEQENIIKLSKNPKYQILYNKLLTLIKDNKKTTNFFKNLSSEDIYCLYYLHMPIINKEINKERPLPHQIVMSATPIPRTLAMSIYGDDIKVFSIKSKPNGRKPIITKQINNDETINQLIRNELNKGYQAYIVCPLINDSVSEKMSEVESVVTTYKKYKKEFSDFKVGMINGDMKQEEINDILDRYVKKEFDILVSTTIIEVGVNNPNATIMVILSSDRFGLSSLHQIRGRVGRNSIQSYCILKPNNPNDIKARILCSTTDGFEIAKQDLKLRGVGDFIGTKQSGKNKYVYLMLAYPDLYDKISKLNDKIFNSPILFEQYKYLLDVELI